jgi:ribosomal protein L32
MAAAQDGNLNSRHSHTETPRTPKMQNRAFSRIDHIIKRCRVGWSEDDAQTLGMNFGGTDPRRNERRSSFALSVISSRQACFQEGEKKGKKEHDVGFYLQFYQLSYSL